MQSENSVIREAKAPDIRRLNAFAQDMGQAKSLDYFEIQTFVAPTT